MFGPNDYIVVIATIYAAIEALIGNSVQIWSGITIGPNLILLLLIEPVRKSGVAFRFHEQKWRGMQINKLHYAAI